MSMKSSTPLPPLAGDIKPYPLWRGQGEDSLWRGQGEDSLWRGQGEDSLWRGQGEALTSPRLLIYTKEIIHVSY